MKKAKSQGGSSSSSSSHSFDNKNGFQYQIENDNTNDIDAMIEDPVQMTSSGYADMLLIWLGRRLLCCCLVFDLSEKAPDKVLHQLFMNLEKLNRISYKFVGSSFVKDVRENSSTPKDICALQEKILRDILGEHDRSIIHDPQNGADMIQERLRNKKVLIVLDDVDDFKL
ncbi:TMV resistance protein N-like protein [Tanacetum coccineum]